jgi:hypothetical protein
VFHGAQTEPQRNEILGMTIDRHRGTGQWSLTLVTFFMVHY